MQQFCEKNYVKILQKKLSKNFPKKSNAKMLWVDRQTLKKIGIEIKFSSSNIDLSKRREIIYMT